MPLPLDLVLVRHGQSEGNVARRLSEKGDDTGFSLLKERHTRSYRLSERGKEQAMIAGKWLVNEFYKVDVSDTSARPITVEYEGSVYRLSADRLSAIELKDGRELPVSGKLVASLMFEGMPVDSSIEDKLGFDRYITSEFTRAMETAALLNLPDAEWFRNFYLTERDWGELESCPESEKEERFGTALRMRKTEPFFWRPPNGESFAELCLRLDRVLQTLHRENSEHRVIIVCHGEVIRAFRVLLERMPQQKFKEEYLSKSKEDAVFNCEIFHYTRRDPATGAIASHANWMRRVRPTETPAWSTGWQSIVRPRYSNEHLLEIVQEDTYVPKVS